MKYLLAIGMSLYRVTYLCCEAAPIRCCRALQVLTLDGPAPAALEVSQGRNDCAMSRVALVEVAWEGLGLQYSVPVTTRLLLGYLAFVVLLPCRGSYKIHCARAHLICMWIPGQPTHSYPTDHAAPRQTLEPYAGLVYVASQPSQSLRSCSSLEYGQPLPILRWAVLFCLRTSVLLWPRISLPGPLLWGSAVTQFVTT